MRYTFGPQLAVDTSGDNLTKGANLTGGTVWLDYAQTTRVTDLQLVDGTATATVDSDTAGWVVFKGPDGEKGPLYVDFGAGPRTISSGEGEADTNDQVTGAGFSEATQDALAAALSAGNAMQIVYDDTAGTYTFAVQTGTTSSTAAAGNDARFASNAAAAAAADAKAVLAQTMAQEPITYVAIDTASTAQKALAGTSRTLDPSGSAGLAAKLKTILEGNKRIQFLGPVASIVELDAQLVATLQDGTSIDFGGIALRVHAGENNGGNSGTAGIILGGAASSAVTVTGFPTTLGQGIDTISHTSSAFATAVPAGTWCHLTSTENRNPNRPLEFFKGEIVRTLSNSSTSWVISNPLRDSYTASLATVRAVPMTTGVEISNLSIISNPSGSSRQNGLVVRNVAGLRMSGIYVTGVEFADGVGIWGCVGYDVQGRSYMVQDRYGPGVQGYGLRLAGSEGGSYDWDGELDRHAVDLGMSSSQWPVTRHTLVRRHRARYCYAAGFAIHDAEFTHTYDGAIQVLNCGGGIIVRGSYTRLIRPVVLGGQAVTYPWGSGTQSTGHGIQVGERTKLNLSAFDDTSANGLGGVGLEIIEPVIDIRGATGDFNAINIEDPLVNARIIGRTPLRPRRVGLYMSGDSITDSVIDVIVDHTAGTGGTGSYGPPSGTTYTGVTLDSATGNFDVGVGNTPPSVGTELINTAGTPASATPAGWGGFVAGATYFVYSVSGTTFKVASRSSGNTASISFTQNLTGLSFIVGKRVHSAYIVPSVSSVNAQSIRRSTINIVSTACRDVPVVIAGARNGGTSSRNTLNVTVTSVGTLGSGVTTSNLPVIRWVGTSCGEWSMGPVDASPLLRANLHSAYTGTATSSGGPLVTYLPGRSVFSDATTDLHQARIRGPRPASGQWIVTEHAGLGSNTTLSSADRNVTRLFRMRVSDVLIDAVGVATAGSAPVLGSGGTYLRYRVGAYTDNGLGSAPALNTAPLATLGDIDLLSTVGQKLAALAAAIQDGSLDPTGSGYWWISETLQYDTADPSPFPTMLFVSTLVPLFGTTDLSAPTVRGWTAGNAMSGALASITSLSRDGNARALVGARAA